MIKNGFKKIIGIGVFVLFGGLFSSCFGSYVDILPNEETTVGNSTVTCDEYFNCTSIWGNNEYNGLAISPNEFKTLFWNSNSQLSYIYYYTNRGNSTVATFYRSGGNVRKVSYTDGLNYNRDSCDYLSSPEEISRDTFIETYKGKQITKYHKTYPNDIAYGCLCLVYNETDGAICFNMIGGLGNPGNYGFYSVDGNYGLSNSFIPADIQAVESSLSPLTVLGGGDSGGGSLVPVFSDVDNAISYFENTKGYNESMCYVGTKNLTGVYGTPGVSFQEGTGDTIFQLYNSLYSGFGSNLVTNVGNFIDVWTLNYFQWFYNSNEEYGVRRLATYNGPDTLYDVYYENLIFPFSNNPVAIFFMASNLYDGYDYVYNYGSYISSYCYMKLNYDNIKSGDIDYVNDVVPLLPSNIDNNIKDYVKYDFNYGNTGYYYSPEWINNLSGDFTLSENYDLDNVFTNFVDVFNSKLGNITFGYTLGIIPDWILYPLIFLILFRIMKH